MLVKFVSILTIILTFFSISVYAENWEIDEKTGKVRKFEENWKIASLDEARAIEKAIKNPGMEIPIAGSVKKFTRVGFIHALATTEDKYVTLPSHSGGVLLVTKKTHTSEPELIIYIILLLVSMFFMMVFNVLFILFKYSYSAIYVLIVALLFLIIATLIAFLVGNTAVLVSFIAFLIISNYIYDKFIFPSFTISLKVEHTVLSVMFYICTITELFV
ncbi:MAG: hypothetical protein AAB614_03075 [Patescibacteria group bacterium]